MTKKSAPPGPTHTGSNAAQSEALFPTDAVIWLIDGFNVLHAGFFEDRDRTRWWSSQNRKRLLQRVEGFEEAVEAIWVVFDGPHATPENTDAQNRTVADRPLHSIFAESADEWILKRVKAAKEPQSIAVVTGDRPLANRVRHHEANVVPPRRFLEACKLAGPREDSSRTPPR